MTSPTDIQVYTDTDLYAEAQTYVCHLTNSHLLKLESFAHFKDTFGLQHPC